MTGCEFAKRFAGKAHQAVIARYLDANAPPVDWFESLFDSDAEGERAVVAVFPLISSERHLIAFLNGLDRGRWRIRRRAKSSPGGDALLGMDWTTKHGDVSEVMGFAPFASMPVPRRAPYVAIATWPGGRANPFRGRGSTPSARPGVVSFLDAKHDLPEAEYETRWAQTTERVTTLMTTPPDDASLYRKTAFVISPEAAGRLIIDR